MRLRVLLVACALAAFAGASSAADKKSAAAALPEVPETLTPAEADAFLGKLTDAQVRALLARELKAKANQEASASAPSEPRGMGPWLMRLARGLETEQSDFSQRTRVLAQGSALLPSAVSSGLERLFGGKDARGISGQLAILGAVLLGGIAALWIVRRSLRVRGLRPVVTPGSPVGARVSAGALRFALDLLPFAAFVLVTLALGNAAFAAGTPERSFTIAYVAGAILVAAMAVVLRLALAPAQSALRLLPLSDAAAHFLYYWLLAVWGIGIFSLLSVSLIIDTGVPAEARQVLTILGGIPLTVTILLMMLLAPLRRIWRAGGFLYVALIGTLWAAAILDGRPSRAGAALASLGILLAFPILDRWVGRAIDDVVGAGDEGGSRREGFGMPLRWAMRVLLAVLLIGAANELWGFQYFEWQASLRRTLIDASFDLVAAFAVAVLGWQFIKIAIDRRLQPREVDGVRVAPSSRLQTLLPLARVFVVTGLIAATAMLVLSGLGVNIGPLLAGAGILGLAIGFGAQTLVRDIITGMFLILDDAFRVGEYIQSGNYKGTVESIGLRSVKLRHHRGPIYVVPFGELRGVQNLARDWVIHKFTIGITYDSDLEKARKLVKKIGQQLAEDPEYKDTILEPLKMQGVEQFGDFAIQVRMKMMTRPGDKQFGLKRKAFALIKKGFDANGIKFAFPTVQIAGGGDAAVAAAATRVTGIKEGTAAA
jgi:moderate conductance mechanosensitive channel